MTPTAERAIVLFGRALGRLADLLPGSNDGWLDRDYDAAVHRASEALEDDASEPLESSGLAEAARGERVCSDWLFEPRVVDALTPDTRDAEWVSRYGVHWRWNQGDQCWTYSRPSESVITRAPVGYIPQASGPFIEVVAQPLMDWQGWAVPAILEVLAEHVGSDMSFGDRVSCSCGDRRLDNWAEHVAPLIAERIACDPQRAVEALSRYKPR
jgi:hypothetical protein